MAYATSMKKWAHFLAVAVLFARVFGSVVHAASAATMSLTMALVDHGAADIACPRAMLAILLPTSMAIISRATPSASHHWPRPWARMGHCRSTPANR